jgi:hypothetical protein
MASGWPGRVMRAGRGIWVGVKGGVVGVRLLHGFGVGLRLVVFGQCPVDAGLAGLCSLAFAGEG